MSVSNENAPAGWRAKLYELENTGTWVDRGTGYVTSVNNNLLMVSEEQNGKILLNSKIQTDDMYERQGESLILWKECISCTSNVDYALSFQDSEGCADIW